MPISIDAFRTWAAANQGATALANQDTQTVEDASNRIGLFDRFFRRGAVRDARRESMAEFTRALGSRYGATIAQQAISESRLSQTSKLSASTITAVITSAERMRAAALRPTTVQDLRLGGATIAPAQIGGYGTAERTFVRSFREQRAVAVELLGEMPLNVDDYEDFCSRVADLTTSLRSLGQNIPGGIPQPAAADEIDALVKALEDKVNETGDLLEGQPLSGESVKDFKHVWTQATLKALNGLSFNAKKQETKNAISAVIAKIADDIPAFEESIPLTKGVGPFAKEVKGKDFTKELAKVVRSLVNEELAQQKAGRLEYSRGEISAMLALGYRRALNEQPWPVIDKKFAAVVGDRPVELESVIVPSEKLGSAPGSSRGPIGDFYPSEIGGYMCHTADTDHAVNLSVSGLTVKGPSGNPELAFCGVRHGVHCAWEIRDANDRAAANAQRAREAVIAAFIAQHATASNPPGLHDLANLPPANFAASGAGNIPVFTIDMVSVSLLTPDTARHAFKSGSSSDERRMLVEQTAAWNDVAQHGVTFTFQGQTIHVMPRIRTFNFGVNAGAVRASVIAPKAFGGWDLSDSMNESALYDLLKDASDYLRANPALPQERKDAISTLMQQCAHVFNAHGERRDSNDAYKVAARVAVLAHLIGGMPCWNCKSGKDRTGEMDVECKFLAALIARGEPIPEPGAPLTRDQTGLFRTIAYEGGNFEVQKANTGFAGFKTGGVRSIIARLGGKIFRKFHAGGSSHVGV